MVGALDPRREPISVSTLVTILTWVATKYGIGLDPGTATAIAVVVFAVGQAVARQLSVPLAKHEQAVKDVKDAAKGQAPRA
jgi:hypothetical protein